MDAEEFESSLLMQAMQSVLQRPRLQTHQIALESVQLEERILFIQASLSNMKTLSFDLLLNPAQGHMGIVVTFMAVLELIRQGEISIVMNGLEQPLVLEKRFSHAA